MESMMDIFALTSATLHRESLKKFKVHEQYTSNMALVWVYALIDQWDEKVAHVFTVFKANPRTIWKIDDEDDEPYSDLRRVHRVDWSRGVCICCKKW